MSKLKKIYIVILVLFIISSFVRFYNLEQRKIFSFDEGSFVVESKTVKYSLDWFGKYLTTMLVSDQRAKDTADLVFQYDKSLTNLTTGRPMHNFFMAVGLYFNLDPLDAGNFMMAFFGVVTVLLTFYLGGLISRSLLVAFLSGLILALLPFHIYYSRSSIAETDSQTLFLLSLICYFFFLKTKKLRYYIFMALMIGVAYTVTASRIAFIAPIFADILINKKEALKRLPLFGILFFIPTLAIEMLYHLVFLLTHNLGIIFPFPTFFEQLLWSYIRLAPKPSDFSLVNLFSYLIMLIKLGGTGFLVAIFYGFYQVVRPKLKSNDFQNYYWITIIAIVTLIFQSLFFLKAARGISPILPLLAIISALGIVSFVNNIKALKLFKGSAVILITIIIIAEFLVKDFQFFDQKTNMSQMISYINSKKIQNIITPSPTLVRAYEPKLFLKLYFENSISDDVYLLTNIQKYAIRNSAYTLSHKLEKNLELIENKCQPEYSVKETFSPMTIEMIAFEHNTDIVKSLDFLDTYQYSQDSEIRLYNLKDCLKIINSTND